MKLHKRVAYIFSSAILSMSSMLVLIAPVAKAAADVCTWTGAGGNALMSNAGNWGDGAGPSIECDGTGVPEPGDSLVFDNLVANRTVNNDLVGASFLNIIFNGYVNADCGLNPYDITGNAFTLGGSVITMNHAQTTCTEPQSGSGGGLSGNVNITAPIVIAGVVTVVASSSTESENLNLFDSTISGSGSIVTQGANININNIAQSVGIGLENGAYLLHGVTDCANAVISSNVALAGAVTMSIYNSVSGFCEDDDRITITNAALAESANLSARYNPVTIGTLTNPSPGTYALTVPNGSATKLTVDGEVLEGDYVDVTYAGTGTSVSADQKTRAIVSGTYTDAYVGKLGYLKGNGGTFSGSVTIATGGFLAPGNSPGCLASGALTLAGTYEVEVQGAEPCTGYDQMNVTGGVTLTGGTLTVASTGYVPTVGQTFTIINNITAGAVTSTFTGLAEGAEVVNAGVTYTISYVGGDGNDVVLTVKTVDASAIPGAPNTGFAMLTNNPLLTTLITLMAVAGLILIARKQNQTN